MRRNDIEGFLIFVVIQPLIVIFALVVFVMGIIENL
jgi:hypothetical protein